MKICYKKLGTSLCLLMSLPLQAQQTTPQVGSFGVDSGPMYSQGNKQVLQDIKNELLYLGYYLGFPIDADSKTPPATPTAPSKQPSNFNNVLLMESESIKNLLGMLSSSIFSPSFVPASNSDSNSFAGYALLNTLANSVIKNNATTSTAFDAPVLMQGQSAVSTTNPISPVSQLVLNILSITPDDLCINSSNQWITNCPFNYTASLIYAQALGMQAFGMGTPTDMFGLQSGSSSLINNLAKSSFMNSVNDTTSNNSFFPTSNQNPQTLYLQQVDSSSFLSPLVYSTQSQSSNKPGNAPFTGLDPNSSQVNAAQAFFRNVTGSVIPSDPPPAKSFQDVQTKLNSTDLPTQMNAFKALSKFILGNRIYAAQESVAIQNIYEIMTKRMPFNDDNPATSSQAGALPANPTPSSDAMNEFIMATYRLYNPSSTSPTTTWQNMISTTSSVNVQREIAILLSELNYQMYLMRQQQERLILVNSISLLNNLHAPGLYSSDDDNNSNS